MTFRKLTARGVGSARRAIADQSGAAASEFVIWAAALVVPLLSAVDLGYYVFQRMQLDNAAQVAAQMGWKVCDTAAKWPATVNCEQLDDAVLAAAQSTSLGASAALQGAVEEGYYCPTSGGELVEVGTLAAKPADCAAVNAGSTEEPGDYIRVTLSYAYSPIFQGLSLAALLPTPITRTAWMRVE